MFKEKQQMLVLDPWDLMGFLKGAPVWFWTMISLKKTSPKLSQSQPPQWIVAPKVCHDPMSCQRYDCQKVCVLVGGLGCFMEDFVARKHVSQWKSNHWMKNVPFLPWKWKTGYPGRWGWVSEMVVFHFHLPLKIVILQPVMACLPNKNALPKTTLPLDLP